MAVKWTERPEMTLDKEIAAINDLSQKVRMIPESEHFGTPTCRAFIIGQTGEFIDRRTQGRHPLTLEWAHKLSKMMGRRRWDEDQAIDQHPNVIIELFKKVSDPSIYNNVHDQLWDFGVVFARSYDMQGNMHYPQTTTVYVDDTSVLRDIATVMGAVVLEKLTYRAWVKFSPTGSKSDGKLIEDSTRFIAEESAKVFGNRFVVNPVVEITPFDAQNNRSWTFKNELYANKSKDTAYASISVFRMSDLGSA